MAITQWPQEIFGIEKVSFDMLTVLLKRIVSVLAAHFEYSRLVFNN